MTELTFAEFTSLPFQCTCGIRYSTGAHRLYRNNKHGLQIEVKTPFQKRTQQWGAGKKYYYIDNDPREFSNQAEWYLAYMHKVCNMPEPLLPPFDAARR